MRAGGGAGVGAVSCCGICLIGCLGWCYYLLCMGGITMPWNKPPKRSRKKEKVRKYPGPYVEDDLESDH